MKQFQYNDCLVSIVNTDGLVLLHQGLSSYSDDYASMCIPVFKSEIFSGSQPWVGCLCSLAVVT